MPQRARRLDGARVHRHGAALVHFYLEVLFFCCKSCQGDSRQASGVKKSKAAPSKGLP